MTTTEIATVVNNFVSPLTNTSSVRICSKKGEAKDNKPKIKFKGNT